MGGGGRMEAGEVQAQTPALQYGFTQGTYCNKESALLTSEFIFSRFNFNHNLTFI